MQTGRAVGGSLAAANIDCAEKQTGVLLGRLITSLEAALSLETHTNERLSADRPADRRETRPLPSGIVLDEHRRREGEELVGRGHVVLDGSTGESERDASAGWSVRACRATCRGQTESFFVMPDGNAETVPHSLGSSLAGGTSEVSELHHLGAWVER